MHKSAVLIKSSKVSWHTSAVRFNWSDEMNDLRRSPSLLVWPMSF